MRINYNDRQQQLVLVPENNDDVHFCHEMWDRLNKSDEWSVWHGDVEEEHWRDENGELEMLFGNKYQLNKKYYSNITKNEQLQFDFKKSEVVA